MLKVTKKQSDHLRRVEMGLYGISLNSQKKGCLEMLTKLQKTIREIKSDLRKSNVS
ncbi:unnamed protein product [marine sediment metagenome]|uniref:Uncharacterized protein n=1 Tax=marine sediment metagenome TaxID=412755 RepID=X1STX6_9ZZZZ